MGRRVQGSHFFSDVGAALLKRQRIEIQYYARASNEITLREISPQRLIHYRDNWYLDSLLSGSACDRARGRDCASQSTE